MNHSKKPAFKSALDFDGRPFAVCLEKIAEQKQYLHIVQSGLPAHIAEHAIHCVINNDRLLVYTDSAVWGSQIRFFQQAILQKILSSGQKQIVRVQIKVLPPLSQAVIHRDVRLPSSETVSAILGQVNNKSNDVLDLALANLANTLKKRIKLEVD